MLQRRDGSKGEKEKSVDIMHVVRPFRIAIASGVDELLQPAYTTT